MPCTPVEMVLKTARKEERARVQHVAVLKGASMSKGPLQ